MWRDGSTAQTELTAKRNNMRQRKGHSAMFGHSAFVAESARGFSSGLTANPVLLLPKNIHEPRMLKDRRALLSRARPLGMRFTRTLDVTGVAAFADHPNLQPASCSFLQSFRCD